MSNEVRAKILAEDYTVEELQLAIELKQKLEDVPIARSIEEIIPDLEKLIENYDEMLKNSNESGRLPKDFEVYGFEDFIKLIYGNEYFNWSKQYQK